MFRRRGRHGEARTALRTQTFVNLQFGPHSNPLKSAASPSLHPTHLFPTPDEVAGSPFHFVLSSITQGYERPIIESFTALVEVMHITIHDTARMR